MKVSIINKNKVELIAEGFDHTLCSILKEELSKNKKVVAVSYTIRHPLMPNPTIMLETEKGVNPKMVIKEGLTALKKQIQTLRATVDKELV